MRSRFLRRPRLRRLLTAAAALTLTTSVVAFIASGFWHYEYRLWDDDGFSARYLQLARGRLELGRTDLFRVMDAGPEHSLLYQPDIPLRWRWRDGTNVPMVSLKPYWPAPDMNWDWLVSIPLWIPAAASALVLAPSLIVGHRQRRRTRVGACSACGYPLAGLVAHRSPECGQPTHTSSIAPDPGAATSTCRDPSRHTETPR